MTETLKKALILLASASEYESQDDEERAKSFVLEAAKLLDIQPQEDFYETWGFILQYIQFASMFAN